jgi:dTDP-4-amino-4,6-dideoxygalactose transaminase
MTTGEGGMLVTNNDAWAGAARRLRSHGIERQHFLGLGADTEPAFAERGPWYYEMQDLGCNYRITDIQCALGLSQLSRLETFIARRREIIASYNSAFAGMPWLTPPGLRPSADAAYVSWHLYTIQIDFRAIGRTRTEVMAKLHRLGVGTQVLYIPVHLQPWFRRTYGYAVGKCPVAEAFYTRALSLPLYTDMTANDVARVQTAVRALA